MTRRAEQRQRRAAYVATAMLVLVTVAVFARGNPFADHHEIRGVFAGANQVAIGGDVRIGGVRVGEVTAIGPGPGDTSVLTMRIDDAGLPIHADATLAVEPRLILEGNFFVRISPGTPGAPELPDGATVPLARTSAPVQVDQVLNVFDLPTRGSLHRAIGRLGRGLGADGAGPSGYAGLRRSVRELDDALHSVEQVARATRGTRPGDLGRTVRGTAATSAQLVRDPAALEGLVTSFSRVAGALAAEDRALAASVSAFDRTLREAPAGLRALDAALPVLTDIAGELRPALRAAPVPLRHTRALLGELGRLARPSELSGLLDELAPATARLPELERRLLTLAPLTEQLTECLRTRVVPTLDKPVPDGATSTGDPAWLDIAHAFTGLTGASPTFDGNGVSTRAGVTQGGYTINNLSPGLAQAIAGGPEIEGVRPTWLGYGVEPPYRPDAPCTSQALPDLGKRSGPPPVWQRAAGRRAR